MITNNHCLLDRQSTHQLPPERANESQSATEPVGLLPFPDYVPVHACQPFSRSSPPQGIVCPISQSAHSTCQSPAVPYALGTEPPSPFTHTSSALLWHRTPRRCALQKRKRRTHPHLTSPLQMSGWSAGSFDPHSNPITAQYARTYPHTHTK